MSYSPIQVAPEVDVTDMEKRLRSRKYIHADAVAASQGIQLPYHLGRELTRLCVVRGIRFHPDFCFGPAAVLRGSLPLFTRALNARAIMSNQVPDMDPNRPEEMPYCIWYPELPSADTLRELVRRFPDMAYQAGRACAIAGHTELYRELAHHILPEVAIAEEARESGHLEIFNLIMDASCRYKVFDDYNRSMNTTSPKPACLNADTAVKPYLLETQSFEPPIGRMDDEEGDSEPDDNEEDPWTMGPRPGFVQSQFNITKDMNVASDGDNAYSGWVESKAPEGVDEERLKLLCTIVFGDLGSFPTKPPALSAGYIITQCSRSGGEISQSSPRAMNMAIRKVISARGIMNNDLSYVLSSEGEYPQLIWYPAVAASSTYEALARLVPLMRPDVARAAIFSNNRWLFDRVITGDDGGDPVEPTFALLNEAKRSHNGHYREVLERRAGELGLDITQGGPRHAPLVQDVPQHRHWFNTKSSRWRISIGTAKGDIDSIYNGMTCNASYVETYMSIPKELRWPPEGFESEDGDSIVDLDYVGWPLGFSKRALTWRQAALNRRGGLSGRTFGF
ncbi:hypothetical protein CMUS01_16438 [Colletotrichum musicola]|uniref:Uncharacterized protein n=1 Tax=Colletotrichum musicola TaxID=2175873 RepID=A0A8H6INR3_9PEZI|nr:hypothetical protein CMUS01_16438 [Colletotrichum musicola]